MINPMSPNDLDAIVWLEETSKTNPSINNAWKVLKAYYEECKEELKNLNDSEDLFESNVEKTRMRKMALDKLKNTSFKKECEEFLGKNIDNLEQLNDLDIVKICRLYNMRLKLGHSARITYIANCELDSSFKDKTSENIEVIRNTVVLSALLHDIGRFYQASRYNNLDDRLMISNESKINDLDVDHAVAGYYYSLGTALELHKISSDNENLRNKLIEEAIAATVVKFHQKSNSDISYFDYNGNSSILENNNLEEVYNFLSSSYDKAKIMDSKLDFKDKKHQEFINNFITKIKNIIQTKKIDYSVAQGFSHDSSLIDELYYELSSEVGNIINKSSNKTVDEVSNEIIELMNSKVKKLTKEDLNKKDKENLKTEITKLLSGMLNFDISESIKDTFQKEQNISEIVRYILSMSISATMDADKIDILNQRALGIYNTNYVIESYEIFPTPNTSLRELLNRYFKYNINSEKIEIDQKTINVINNLSSKVRNGLSEYLSEFELFENGQFREDIKVSTTRDKIIIENKNGEIKEFLSSDLYDVFNNNWIDVLTTVSDFEKIDFKEFKDKYFGQALISVTREDLEDNTKNLSHEEKLSVYKKLLVTDGLKERFMKESNNQKGSGWIKQIEKDDSSHLATSTISGLLWQLNQFILVNMRNKSSYEFIEKYAILDDIYNRFQESSPLIAEIIKEYIDYCKFFVQNALQKTNSDTLTEEILEQLRKDTYEHFQQENIMFVNQQK